MICKLCGHDEFHGHQGAYTDIVVDEGGDFIRDYTETAADIYDFSDPYGPFTCLRCGASYDDLEGGRHLAIGVKERDSGWKYIKGVGKENLILTSDTQKAIHFSAAADAGEWMRISHVGVHYTYKDMDYFVLDYEKKLQPVTFYVVQEKDTHKYLWSSPYASYNVAKTRHSANKYLSKRDAQDWAQRVCGPDDAWNIVMIKRDMKGETITSHDIMEAKLREHLRVCMDTCNDKLKALPSPDNETQCDASPSCGRKPPDYWLDDIKRHGWTVASLLEKVTSRFGPCSYHDCPRFSEFRDQLSNEKGNTRQKH